MKTITHQEMDALCKNGRAIDSKGGYPAVILHPDDTVSKIWARKKNFLSSATIWPYSTRFINNAEKLARRGVSVPKILDHAKLENSPVRIVTYQSLPGTSIRDLLLNSPQSVDIPALCRYYLELHDKGIYYRTIHLGNIIQLPDHQGFGLIDFTDVQFSKKPLSLKRRASNIAVPVRKRYLPDVQAIEKAGLPNLIDTYLDLLNPPPEERQLFLTHLKNLHK